VNTLYFGDNLGILRDKIPSGCVDLIYLDPPFKSGKSYNIIFQPELRKIKGATAQIKTFEDTWQWGDEAENEYQGLITGTITKEKPNQSLIDLIKAMRGYLGECSMMAYFSMMAPRLLEMRRVMKETASIYLHCDPTASHYLKLLMDAIFGVNNFRNEIVWQRTGAHSDARRWGRVTDTLLFYSKTESYTWETQYAVYDEEYIKERYHYKDEATGRLFWPNTMTAAGPGPARRFRGKLMNPPSGTHWRFSQEEIDRMEAEGRIYYSTKGMPYVKSYLDERKGKAIQNVWTDIRMTKSGEERLGYPTQKPEALLERIIKASSKEGDLVLDPFCGCGTTIAVAESQKRKWIGIDITYLAIDVIRKRLEKNGIKEGENFKVDGEPTDVYSAEKFAEQNPFQFQIWCVSKLDATPSQMKTGDQGIDGILNFVDLTRKEKAGKGIIQVKGTQSVNPSMVRDLKGTMKSQNADFGILITLKKATQGMITEAVKEGYAESTKKIPKIQLLTVEDLFKKPIPIILPGQILPPYRKPEFKKEQRELFLK
jgi:adenine specific DNA methylase Mod